MPSPPPSSSPLFLPVLLFLLLPEFSSIHASNLTTANGGGRGVLLSFKESPSGTNLTFACSPSGPCVPCGYSETMNSIAAARLDSGYRIPFKCVEIKHGAKIENGKHSQNGRSTLEISDNANLHVVLHDSTSNEHRSLLGDSSIVEGGSESYITYRSCISPNTERLSVLGFEGIILLLLLVSGSIVYLRRKQTVTMPGAAAGAGAGAGAGRIQMNRF